MPLETTSRITVIKCSMAKVRKVDFLRTNRRLRKPSAYLISYFKHIEVEPVLPSFSLWVRMGTLTYNDIRLPQYCEHKLPTSCRLSSIPNCCACADERAHAPSYSTYIDGIGFVSRGNRWQRYCWYCKEFWENRVRASGLRPGQTRIPENPDQKEFLERWYEFHRGYRIVRNNHGREERVAVVGEDFRNVSPGCLPRTLAEMRDGRRAAGGLQRQIQHNTMEAQQATGPSLEQTLESMFTDAANEERAPPTATSTSATQQSQQPNEPQVERTNIHAQAMNPVATRNREYQVRRVAALRRELTRMRTGIERVISGLRDLGENVPDDTESEDVINRLNAIIDRPARETIEQGNSGANNSSDRGSTNMQARIDEARRQVNVARQARDHAASELETAETEFQALQQHLQLLQREQRTVENYMRVFGTREEVIAQGENYESPIRSMFTRAMERFRAAEDVRREERTLRQVLEDEARIDTDEAVARRLEELESRERDVWGVPQSQDRRMSRLAERLQARSVQDAVAHTSDTDAGSEIVTDTGGIVRIASPDYVDVTVEIEAPGDENETPPVLSNTNEESMLQEYYAMIRRQDWSQQARSGGEARPENETNFPRNMLNAIVAARAREVAERNENAQHRNSGVADERDVNEAPLPQFSEEEWWHEDAEIIIRALTTDEALREELGMGAQDAAALLAYFIDDFVSERGRTTIDGLLRNETAIWRTGLPVEWLKRRTELVRAGLIPEPGLFLGDGGYGGSVMWALHHNRYLRIEVAAQAYMMSAEVRRSARTLTPPQRLQMLYRLQSGRRTDNDVRILHQMTEDETLFSLVLAVYRRNLRGEEEPEAEPVNARRRQLARRGDHSRQELDARRRDTSTRAFALAAGRQAMQTGSQALMEQAANAAAIETDDQEAGTRAAFHRLQTSGFARRPERTTPYRQLTLSDYLTSSPGSSRSSSPEASRGLDARDSGRPEPKSDEELLVSMECKICYTQMAEIACLPCGHLVMCRWCSEQHSPCLTHDRTRPRRPTGCPVCRKTIRQKARVFRV